MCKRSRYLVKKFNSIEICSKRTTYVEKKKKSPIFCVTHFLRPVAQSTPQEFTINSLTMSAAGEEFDNGPSSKRHRHDDRSEPNEVALYAPPLEDDIYLQQNDNIRTSSLAEPTMKLSGHKGSVYCLAYDPQGEWLCSGSFDSTCLIWKGEFSILACTFDVHVMIFFILTIRFCSFIDMHQPAGNARMLTCYQDTRMLSSTYASLMTRKK